MIELVDISRDYRIGDDKLRVLHNINLKIQEKDFISILGSSGSGKSTLMHIMGLLDQPTGGKLMIDGRDVSRLSDNELSRLRSEYVGFVFQQFNLINKLTVLENVLLPTIYQKRRLTFNPEKRALELLNQFNLYDRKDFYPNKISGGQQQRVAIARSLIMNPKIILADEPTGNLDTKTGNEILDLLEKLNKTLKVAVVIVTHEKDVAERTKRQIYLRDGRIVKKYL